MARSIQKIGSVKSSFWPWFSSRILVARILNEAVKHSAFSRTRIGNNKKDARAIRNAKRRLSSIKENPAQWRGPVSIKEERPGGYGDTSEPPGGARRGSIWDSTRHIYRNRLGHSAEWVDSTIPFYRSTERLTRFEISTDPSDEGFIRPPREHTVVLPDRHGFTKSFSPYCVVVRLVDFEMGIVTESLSIAPYETNKMIAERRMDLARRQIKTQPDLPGVHWMEPNDYAHRAGLALMKIACQTNGLPEEDFLDIESEE